MLVTFPFLFPAGEDFDKGREAGGCVSVKQELTPFCGLVLLWCWKYFYGPCIIHPSLGYSNILSSAKGRTTSNTCGGGGGEGNNRALSWPSPSWPLKWKGAHRQTVASLHSRPGTASWGSSEPFIISLRPLIIFSHDSNIIWGFRVTSKHSFGMSLKALGGWPHQIT